MALIDRIAKSLGPVAVPVPLGGLTPEMPKVTNKPFHELGSTGLLRTKGVGYVYEEWLSNLSTYRQKQIYREMRDNDAIVGSMFFALEMLLRRAVWHVEPAEVKSTVKKASVKEAEKLAQFVEECLGDMSSPFEDFIAECVNMFAFGFALFETIYKRRMGPDGKKSSKYNDGLIGWRKFAPRAQESILYWIWDDEGGLQGCVQLAAPDYATITLPIKRLLLFRTTSLKNNPEGRSILRNCYRSWFHKKRIEEVEGIGIERDLCGIPVLYTSAEALEQMGGENVARALVRNIRIDDQAGVLLPLAYDEKGNPLVKLELLRSGGGKQSNATETVRRLGQDMLNTILAGFIQLGQTPSGSRALHMSATGIFTEAIAAFMDSVAGTLNRFAIPRLLAMNQMEIELAPKIVPGDIGRPELDEMASYVSRLAAAGLTFFDKETSDYLRKIAHLPEQPEDAVMPGMPPGMPGQPPVGGKPQANVPQEGEKEKPKPEKDDEEPEDDDELEEAGT